MKVDHLRLPGLLILTLTACGDTGATTSNGETNGDTASTPGDGDGDGDGDPATTSGDGDGDDCPEPDPFVPLAFFTPQLELPPGGEHQYQIGQLSLWEREDVCASYSIEPEAAGASIDAETGLLQIDADTPDGSEFLVSAAITNWPADPIEGEVLVYVPELHPLKGYWTEVARIPCDNGPEFVPAHPIGELVFTAAGDFRVTWEPFETYVDYWGTYSSELDTGALALTPSDGNYVPDDIDGEGSYTIEGGQLLLHEIWLGSWLEAPDPPEPPACGHRFE